MPTKIRVRRRLNSGNIYNEDMHRERLADQQMKRQAFWTITLVTIGSIAFIAVSVMMRLSS